MPDPRAFVTLKRAAPQREPVASRVLHWREFYAPLAPAQLQEQGARCMDCGVPFCHSDRGCPVRNVIPEWNVLVARDRWREALDALHATNNFPELTGRLCPAPCESACVLGLIDAPVAIRTIEQAIADRGFDEGWITPAQCAPDTRKRVAIVGSGPAGLAAAQQLRRSGHAVHVFEKSDRIGGLLQYGIPSFKLDKLVLDRRLVLLEAEGVRFHTNARVGVSPTVARLQRDFDAVLLATGADAARDLRVPGRELSGIHQAMDFLIQQNRRDAGLAVPPDQEIHARDKNVVIIGGGDTGSDCAGTCIRQGARSVKQYELLPRPPQERAAATPWPLWPMQLRTSHAHEEGCERDWSVSTTAFSGSRGRVGRLHGVRIEPEIANGRTSYRPIDGSEFQIEADLVLLAMGFSGATRNGMMADLGVATSETGTVITDASHHTDVPGVFAAGDVRRGASLIVWAIREGRDAAAAIDAWLTSLAGQRSTGMFAAAK